MARGCGLLRVPLPNLGKGSRHAALDRPERHCPSTDAQTGRDASGARGAQARSFGMGTGAPSGQGRSACWWRREIGLDAVAALLGGGAELVAGLGIEAQVGKQLRAETAGELQPRRLL